MIRFIHSLLSRNLFRKRQTIKETITSLKKFYDFMEEIDRLVPDDYFDMLQEIKESKEEWLENLRDYDEGIASRDFR